MKGLYHKLAWQNLRHNYQFYVPYLLTIIGTAAVFYITMALAGASDLPGQIRYSYLKSFMLIGVWIIGLFAVIFLFYTNSFLMKRRKKELGLYNVLGLGKGHMARVLIWETLYIGAAGIVGGIALGLLFQRLMTLLVYRAVRYVMGFEFYFCWRGMVTTAILFGSILLLNLLVNLLKMRGQNPVTMMREGNAGEREPKTKWFLALLGAAALGVGYYIALTTQTAMEAFSMYFVAVFAVILGTYCLFTAGGIVILKLLRKNKRYYYQTNHFITVSGMLYRMKQNAVGLANICVLCTMVLVMISGTVSLYLGTESLAESRMPADWNTTLRYYPAEGEEPDLGAIRARVAEAAEGQGLEVQEQTAFSYLRRSFSYRMEMRRGPFPWKTRTAAWSMNFWSAFS